MKKVFNTLILIFTVFSIIVGLAGCSGNKVEPYSISIDSLLKIEGNIGIKGPAGGFMNAEPFENEWADFPIYLPSFPEEFDWSLYNRIRVIVKYYFDDGEELNNQLLMEEQAPNDGKVAVTLIYDPEGDWRGPPQGPGPNTPVKEFNVGGGSGTLHTAEGAWCFIEKDPGMLLIQSSSADVGFIEVMEISFFNAE